MDFFAAYSTEKEPVIQEVLGLEGQRRSVRGWCINLKSKIVTFMEGMKMVLVKKWKRIHMFSALTHVCSKQLFGSFYLSHKRLSIFVL